MSHSNLGDHAVDLVAMFPEKFPNVRRFYFKPYTPQPGFEERMGELSICQLFLEQSNVATIVQKMLGSPDVKETASSLEEVGADHFSSRYSSLRDECRQKDQVLALCSYCRDPDDNEMHIPMMDFRVRSGGDSGRKLEFLSEALRGLGQTDGVLLDSGKSYHYFGFHLLTQCNWRKFMAQSLLLGSLVDVRYISHRLQAGTATLRLTTSEHKTKMPQVVAHVG